MTNREAINLLEEIKVNKAYTEALEMALKALEAEEVWYESHEYPHKEQWIPEACRGCSNHPSNGGSGICHCTLGSIQWT